MQPHPIVIRENIRVTTQSATFGKRRKTHNSINILAFVVGLCLAGSYFAARMI